MPVYSRQWPQGVTLRLPGADDLAYLDTSCQQCVRNQRAMASPWDSFGTHQRGRFHLRERNARVQAVPEFRRLHVVGVTAKAGVPPPGVSGVAAGTPTPAQPGQMGVVNVKCEERRAQPVAPELRIVSRVRDRPHVDDMLDSMCLQQLHEIVNRPCRVTNGEDDERRQLCPDAVIDAVGRWLFHTQYKIGSFPSSPSWLVEREIGIVAGAKAHCASSIRGSLDSAYVASYVHHGSAADLLAVANPTVAISR